jgi:hypothetical protein
LSKQGWSGFQIPIGQPPTQQYQQNWDNPRPY